MIASIEALFSQFNFGREQIETLVALAEHEARETNDYYLIRKLADLLYIGHADYVAAKQRARESA